MSSNLYSPQRETATQVYVNGTQLPAAETDIHIRKEGPLATTRYAEVTFASPWNEFNYLNIFSVNKEGKSFPDILYIETKHSDGYAPLFRGVVTGLGNSAQHENTKMFQCRAQGPAHRLDKITAGKVFQGTGITAQTVLEYIVEELDFRTPIEISLHSSASETESANADVDVGRDSETNINIIPFTDLINPNKSFNLNSPKTFQKNKHVLGDVVNWLQDKIAGRMWIEPTPDGATLVVTDAPTQDSLQHTAHYLENGTTEVITNNAVQEIRPLNTITVHGQAKTSHGDVGDFEITVPSDEFSSAKARHTELYNLAGETELSDTVQKIDAQSTQDVENEARSRLKRAIDETTSGTLSIRHNRLVTPYDTIVAKPTATPSGDGDLSPLTYEVHRAHYKTRPNDDDVTDHIELNVGFHTDMQDDIEILNSWSEDVY